MTEKDIERGQSMIAHLQSNIEHINKCREWIASAENFLAAVDAKGITPKSAKLRVDSEYPRGEDFETFPMPYNVMIWALKCSIDVYKNRIECYEKEIEEANFLNLPEEKEEEEEKPQPPKEEKLKFPKMSWQDFLNRIKP